MSYSIEITLNAERDIEKFKKSGDKKILLKINQLLDELRIHPTSGTGKPEQLKHYNSSTWSRKITSKHRLVYNIQDDKVVVLVLSFWGHYNDK